VKAVVGSRKRSNEKVSGSVLEGLGRPLRRVAYLMASVFLGGCIVQSLNPFYTPSAVIQMPQLDGEWMLVKDYGDDALPANIQWTFQGKRLETRDKRGARADVEVVYFKVQDSLYADFAPGDADKLGVSEYWLWTVTGVHTLCKVMLSEGAVTLLPLDYDWLQDQVEKKKAISLPFVRAEEGDELLFTATAAMWMSFLEKYGQESDAFSPKRGFVLKRPKG
jgi:hypothetical protein